MRRSSTWPRKIAYYLTYGIILLSSGNFNPSYFGVHEAAGQIQASPQQYLIVLLWLMLIGITFLSGVFVEPLRLRGLFWPMVVFCFAVASPLWSLDPHSAAEKAMVFFVVSVGVWRLTCVISMIEFFEIFYRSLWVLMAISAVLLIVDPTQAIGSDYRLETHSFEPFWQGLFDQKQTLGIAAAQFVFLALMHVVERRSVPAFIGFVLGMALVIGSGSRGGGLVAMATTGMILAGRRRPWVYRTASLVLPACVAIGILSALYLFYSDQNSFLFNGTEFSISERTYIWQYVMQRWVESPLLGFGLNGFWTDPDIWWGFARRYGWPIADYHSGYLAVLVEIGIAGMIPFIIMVVSLCSRLRLIFTRPPTLGAQLAFGMLVPLFLINLTETTILRSTNIGQVTLTFVAINVFRVTARRIHSHPSSPRGAASAYTHAQ